MGFPVITVTSFSASYLAGKTSSRLPLTQSLWATVSAKKASGSAISLARCTQALSRPFDWHRSLCLTQVRLLPKNWKPTPLITYPSTESLINHFPPVKYLNKLIMHILLAFKPAQTICYNTNS